MERKSQSSVGEVTSSPPGRHEQGDRDGRDVLELVTRSTEERRRIDGVVIGTLTALPRPTEPTVDFAANTSRDFLPARSTAVLSSHDVGREVAILFEGGDPQKPIVIGLMNESSADQIGAPRSGDSLRATTRNLEVDGERMVLTAQNEIVLRCGKASITLTRAGKIVIRGTHLVSRSSGMNRIKGGSVQIN
jgi:hypothetical protein